MRRNAVSPEAHEPEGNREETDAEREAILKPNHCEEGDEGQPNLHWCGYAMRTMDKDTSISNQGCFNQSVEG